MENNKIKGIIFIDNKENGYGNIDAVRDDEKNLIIPTKQQKRMEKWRKIFL